MKTLSLLGTAVTALTLATGAFAQSTVDTTTLTCAEFLAMDSSGMMQAGEAVGMAHDAMSGDAMADDAMADDAMASDAMEGDAMEGDAMAGDAMEGDAMEGDAMADDAMAHDGMDGDMTARITAACTAHPEAEVVDALAM